MYYLRIFLIFAVGFGVFFHAVTREPMPWWPDTAFIGAFMGALAVLIVSQHHRDRRAWRRWRALARDTRIWWKTRNTV